MKKLWVMLLVLLCAACAMRETGTLAGHVSLTMMPVVVKDTIPPTPAPEAFAERQMVIFSANGKREVARTQIDGQGNYRIILPAGVYVVDINHAGMDRGIDLPATVEVKAQHITQLDIDIDTGIR